MIMSMRRKLARGALGAFTLFCLSRAVSYWTFADDPVEAVPAIMDNLQVPVITWALVWAAAGLTTLAGAVVVKAWGYAPTIVMSLFWATGYLWLIPGDDTIRSIANAGMYAAVATLAWIAGVLTQRRGILS